MLILVQLRFMNIKFSLDLIIIHTNFSLHKYLVQFMLRLYLFKVKVYREKYSHKFSHHIQSHNMKYFLMHIYFHFLARNTMIVM